MFLPFTALSGFDLSFRLKSPKHPARNIRARRRLGAAKEEKPALRQTEGRTRDARADAGGETARSVVLHRALRHRRIAVPPAEIYGPTVKNRP